MAKSKANKIVTTHSAEELGEALGLSVADTAEMEFRSELTATLYQIIRSGNLTHAIIAKRSGTSRTRVTAVANGNTRGVSTDVLIRILAATGYRADVRIEKMANALGLEFIPMLLPKDRVRRRKMLEELLDEAS